MKLFHVEYRYETPTEKGHGRMVVMAGERGIAIEKAKMIGGADSRMTNCEATEIPGGFFRLGTNVDETAAEIASRQMVERERSVAQKYEFEVAAKAVVVALDRWEAYRKLAGMLKQTTPPPGLKRKVVSQEPIDTQSRFDANAAFKHHRMFQGGKAGG